MKNVTAERYQYHTCESYVENIKRHKPEITRKLFDKEKQQQYD